MSQSPLLSVLMPTIWSRRHMFSTLWEKLERLSAGYPVEILALLDNKKRTIGAKCNDLIQAARGNYLTFVDDDDDVSVGYFEHILEAIDRGAGHTQNGSVQVISYHVACRLECADGKVIEGVVTPAITNPNEEFHAGTVLRKPLQTSVWRSDIAKSAQWLDANYEADTAWASQLWPQLVFEISIPRILYCYRWSAKGTEAK